MSIEILGQTQGAERDAAESLKRKLQPILRDHDKITIVAGAKCYGQRKEDIDLLVIAQFAPGFAIPQGALPPDMKGRQIHIGDLMLVIEVKDHDGAHIKIEGNQVRVRYKGRWSDASKQVMDQVHSLSGFLLQKLRLSTAPFIYKALWLRNAKQADLPTDGMQVLTGDASPLDLLRIIAEQNRKYINDRLSDPVLMASTNDTNKHAILNATHFFTKTIEPGTLDRKRLEILCKKLVRDLKNQQYLDKLGTQTLIFRGRGGAGKTLRLLNIGNHAREETGARVLLLTYNKALVADIKRLLAVLGVNREIDSDAIEVRSQDSYFVNLLEACGLPSPDNLPLGDRDAWYADYSARKQTLLDVLNEMTTASIQANADAEKNPDCFAWDLILIDEGQDWPEVDRDILLRIFGPERLIVADGMDQFVHRQPKRCNWDVAKPHQIVTYHRSMRLKANLCRFVGDFALDSGLEWGMEPNEEVSGGRIQILLNGYTTALHRRLMEDHRNNGNHPIDSLFCVTGAREARYKDFAKNVAANGWKVWDGTREVERQDYPRELSQHRIVKYESCRGLEGWTVVCLDLGLFFERKLKEGRSLKTDLFDSPEDAALRHAARWCLIPFTRAIDTLVLQLPETSRLWERLEPIARAHSDFVEVIR